MCLVDLLGETRIFKVDLSLQSCSSCRAPVQCVHGVDDSEGGDVLNSACRL